jgi:RHS repeat-associated protein
MVYENGVQKMLLTEEGYVDLSNNTYYYYLKDHQGNNRIVLSSGGTVAETNHYYPFGGLFASTSVQPYKYNGKELDTKKGLNWYDYGARHYDATLGRWLVVDPLAEKYYSTSVYGYCLNNPIGYIDPDGKSVWTKALKVTRKVSGKISQKGFSALKEKSTYVEAFADVIEDTKTVFDENASIGDRVVAGLSLASELLPVSINDAKDVSRLLGIHGNSKMSEKAQHAYDIIDKDTGKRVKTGVSGGKVRSDGKSYRAEQQVRKWNKEAGYEKYESVITHEEPAGEGSRARILEYEKVRPKVLEDELDDVRHKRP